MAAPSRPCAVRSREPGAVPAGPFAHVSSYKSNIGKYADTTRYGGRLNVSPLVFGHSGGVSLDLTAYANLRSKPRRLTTAGRLSRSSDRESVDYSRRTSVDLRDASVLGSSIAGPRDARNYPMLKARDCEMSAALIRGRFYLPE